MPQEVKLLDGQFRWARGMTTVLAEPNRADDQFAAAQLAEELARHIEGDGQSSSAGSPVVYIGLVTDGLVREQADAHEAIANRGPEAYVLLVHPRRIIAAGNAPAGTFYAVQTLKQLVRANSEGGSIPCAKIVDWPDLRYRGYSDDISRGPIPTMDFLKREVRTMAEFKMNMLTLYTEHVFKLRKHPSLAPPDGITAQEIRELSKYARRHHVELVGNFQSLGHMRKTLAHEEYSHLRESWDVITPAKEETYRLLGDAYQEVASAYSSGLFHVNCDEPYGLGTGPSKPLAEEIGVTGVYVRHVNRLHKTLRERHGKRMMMWADFLLSHPEALQVIPKDTILLPWHYEARDGYDNLVGPLAQAGFQFMVSPGVSCWRRVFPHYNNAVANIQRFVRDGHEAGALGMMNTTWDDDGENLFHWNFYGTNWGAACAWRPARADLEKYDAAYAPVSHGAPDSKITRAIRLLADCAEIPITRGNRNEAFWEFPFAQPIEVSDSAAQDAAQLCETSQKAVALLEAARQEVTLDAEDLDYILFAAKRLHCLGRAWRAYVRAARAYSKALETGPRGPVGPAASRSAIAHALTEAHTSVGHLAKTVEGLRREYERLWLQENRRSHLSEVLRKYDELLASLEFRTRLLASAKTAVRNTGVAPSPQAIGLGNSDDTYLNRGFDSSTH